MTRKVILKATVVCLLLFGISVSCFASVVEQPNVVLVMTDDQGYGDLSCHGNPILKTPNLDSLYDESIRFTDFHVSPFCTPTRAALMTGRYPARTGSYRTSAGRSLMHPDEQTIADVFAVNGYATGMVGKWHLGDNAPHRPQDRGFQQVVWHRCGGIGQASDHWGNDYFDDTYERNGRFEKFTGYCTDVWFREGIRFIERNRERPFFLYLALNAPHGPYRVPDEWAQPYRENSESKAFANFYGMIANIDHNMGLLRKRLDELGLAENTILVFMTDNGTAAGAKFKGLDSEALAGFNAGMRGKKSSVYDGGHRVPFFIRWPGGELGGCRDISTLAAHIDVLPTLAELCGIAVPGSHEPDGISLVPLLRDSKEPWPRDYHVVQFHGGAGGSAPLEPFSNSVVLTKRWRLVNSGNQQLFDIIADPAQRTDLASKHPEIVSRLRTAYQPYWESVSPRMKPVHIDLGSPAENPTTLCSQDWYMLIGNPPWNFNAIQRLPKVTKPWMVNVTNPGRYRLTLRQWPKEATKLVVASRARVVIAGKEVESDVKAGSEGVVFEIDLPAGKSELWTYLYDGQGKVGGAYFTEVERLP